MGMNLEKCAITSLRAVGLVIAVAGIFYLTACDRTPRYRELDSGQWSVPEDQIMVFSFQARRSSKVKIEVTPKTGQYFGIYLVDETSYNRIRRLMENGDDWTPDDVRTLYHDDGKGPFLIEDFHLTRGKYAFLVEHFDSGTAEVDYTISELR